MNSTPHTEPYRVHTEKDMDRTYTVVTLYPLKDFILLGYQMEMLARNPLSTILSADTKRKNDEVQFYFDITGKGSIKDYLHTHRLSKSQFIGLLTEVMNVMQSGSNLLLNESNFIMRDENIYYDPKTSSLSFLYLPVKMAAEGYKDVKDFIIRLITKTAFIEIHPGDDFLHRIIEYIKKEDFNPEAFSRFLIRMKNEDVGQNSPAAPLFEPAPEPAKNKPAGLSAGKSQAVSVTVLVLLQALILCGATALVQVSRNYGFDTISSYAGAFTFAALCELLAVRYFINRKKRLAEEGGKIPPKNPDMSVSNPMKSIDKTAEPLSKPPKGNIQEETALLTDSPAPQAYLITGTNGDTEQHEVTKDSFIIGRSESLSDMPINEKAVGRVHAELITRGRDYFIMDKESKNGTYLNHEKLVEKREYKLNSDDILIFANREYRFIVK